MSIQQQLPSTTKTTNKLLLIGLDHKSAQYVESYPQWEVKREYQRVAAPNSKLYNTQSVEFCKSHVW